MRSQRTKALLYARHVLGAVLSGCTNSVIAAEQVTPIVVPAACTSANSSMNVVAHEDDDILFIDSPTYLDVTAGRCLTTVYLTAGDDGQGASYWQGREDGAMAAYAKMARTRNAWTTTEAPNRIRPGGRHTHAERDGHTADLPAPSDRQSRRSRHLPPRVPQQAARRDEPAGARRRRHRELHQRLAAGYLDRLHDDVPPRRGANVGLHRPLRGRRPRRPSQRRLFHLRGSAGLHRARTACRASVATR